MTRPAGYTAAQQEQPTPPAGWREEDRGKRFALWSFLHMFGSAPDLDVAFENEEDREAARNFMDLLAASEGDGAG